MENVEEGLLHSVQRIWSERPGSNRRQSRWQRDALPTELRSQQVFQADTARKETYLITFPLADLYKNRLTSKWCARQDLNLQPFGSKPNTLSS